MKVLIAEDDPISRQLLEHSVKSLGYDAVIALDGLGAWNIVRQQEIRIVIADWEMPGMSGLALCRRIRSGVLTRYIFVIMLTSKTSKKDLLEGLEAGADEYLTKPFNRAELQARLRSGSRIIDLENELSAKNSLLTSLNARLQEMARTDALLAIGNRRSLVDILSGHLPSSRKMLEGGFALVMCDVDDFKAYNDTYGHLAGDQALKQVVDSMKAAVGDAAMLFRYGGEEILALMPGAGVQEARATAERFCACVRDLDIVNEGSRGRRLTISCGVVARNGDAGMHWDWEAALKRADNAMYRAKTMGKDRVEAA